MSNRVFFYCDESGAKGYGDQQESYPGEVGVFAGILVPEEMLGSVAPQFDAIAAKYKPASGKLHIADLPDGHKESLRQEVYEAVGQTVSPCFWYAIHVAGLHAEHKRVIELQQKVLEQAREARGGEPPRVKGGSRREEPASMHVELFAGLYAHLVAFLLERGRQEVDIEIRTDQVDSPIVQKFVQVAERLLREGPEVTRTSGFDTVTKEVVEGTITVEVKYPPGLKMPPLVRSLSIKPVSDKDGLVLAADVLANSLNHLFKNRSDAELYTPLNSPKAVANHSLAPHLDAFENWGGGDLVGDILYRHPHSATSD